MKPEVEKKQSFRDFLSYAAWSIKIYWKINPKLAFLSLFLGSLLQVFGVANNFIFAKLVDAIISLSQGNMEQKWIYYIVLILFIMSLIRTVIGNIEGYSVRTLQIYSYPKFQELLYKKLQKLGVSTLEQPEVNNLVARTQQNLRTIETQFRNASTIVGILTSLITNGVVVFLFAPHLIPLLLIVSIPYVFFDLRYQKTVWSEDKRITEKRRMAYDSAGILQDPKMLQELLITHGNGLLEKKFESFVEAWTGFMSRARAAFYKKIVLLRVLRFSVEGYADYLIIVRFLAKRISIGDVTFYLRSVSAFASDLQALTDFYSGMFESSLRIKEIKELFEMESMSSDGSVNLRTDNKGPEVKLENVSFSYPNSKNPVIKDINIHIKSGEKIAIVGHNGAGKTTLVKLLCRFYKVSEGKLVINDININDIKIASWYKNIGVLFQEYNTYPHLTVRENINIGRLSKVSTKSLIRAAKRADADDFIKEFEKGFDQTLSERYKGGTRPSTGQWQKIAIARFFYRNAPLVIFDEPTAAIDAVSEKKIFDKIYKFFNGKTVIIISHRFSTVRNADRIIVFEKGKVIEQGNHTELMAKNGKYAEAFRIQAEGYKH